MVLEENRTLDLVRFIFCPDCSLKFCNIERMVLQFMSLALAKRVSSSAKNRCDIFGPNLLILMGCHWLCSTALSMDLESLSMHMMNR